MIGTGKNHQHVRYCASTSCGRDTLNRPSTTSVVFDRGIWPIRYDHPLEQRKLKARYQRESVACFQDCTWSLPDGSADSIVFMTILPIRFRQKPLTAYPRQPATNRSVERMRDNVKHTQDAYTIAPRIFSLNFAFTTRCFASLSGTIQINSTSPVKSRIRSDSGASLTSMQVTTFVGIPRLFRLNIEKHLLEKWLFNGIPAATNDPIAGTATVSTFDAMQALSFKKTFYGATLRSEECFDLTWNPLPSFTVGFFLRDDRV